MTTFGGSLQKCVFQTETVILFKLNNPVSITHVLWKDRGLLVKIRSMQLGFSGFLKHVSCLMRLFKLQELQKFLKVSLSTHTSNLSRSIMFSYFVENASNALLIISRWFLMLFLLGLYEQFTSHFFLRSIISTKKLSAERKSWLFSWNNRIPPPFSLR